MISSTGAQVSRQYTRRGDAIDGLAVSSIPEATGISAQDGPVAVDIETYATGGRSGDVLSPYTGDIRLITISDSSGRIQTCDLACSGMGEPLPSMMEVFTRDKLIAHNASFELRWLAVKYGIFPKRVFCTRTASWLLSPTHAVKHDLGSVLKRHLGVEIPKDLGRSDWGAIVLTPEQLSYSKNDVRYLHRLQQRLSVQLGEAKLAKVFRLETALLPIIARMEASGFSIDADRMRSLRQEADARAAALLAEIRSSFNNDKLNPGSPKQIVEAFNADGVGITDSKEETLAGLDDPRAARLLGWREHAKLSSMIATLLAAERGGRIHTDFNPMGTVTGRFTSKGPNLQQITRGPLRTCFVPSGPNHRLVVGDFSQVELRVAALVAGETVMIDALRRGADLHRTTAALALRKPLSEVTAADRQIAKSANFGLLYGMSAAGFAVYARMAYGVSLTKNEAEDLRDSFFRAYPGLRRWHNACHRKSECRSNNNARTILGRLLIAQKDDHWARFNMFTEYVVSGSCADLIKAAMVKVASVMPEDARLVATVHDELVLDCPADTAERCRKSP
jgi:DNA polymerase I-like protein with 3'-5' exonuclease and polymerase domains